MGPVRCGKSNFPGLGACCEVRKVRNPAPFPGLGDSRPGKSGFLSPRPIEHRQASPAGPSPAAWRLLKTQSSKLPLHISSLLFQRPLVPGDFPSPPPLANGKVFRRKGPFCVLERERSPGLCPVVSGLHTYRASPRPWACASSSAAIRRHRALPSATRPCYLFHRRVKPLLRTCWKIVRLRTRLPKIHSDFRGGKLPDFRRLKNPVLRMPTGDFAVFPPRWKTTNTPYPWIFEAKKTQYMVAK